MLRVVPEVPFRVAFEQVLTFHIPLTLELGGVEINGEEVSICLSKGLTVFMDGWDEIWIWGIILYL